jgi:hypothetical protein
MPTNLIAPARAAPLACVLTEAAGWCRADTVTLTNGHRLTGES